MKWHQHGQAMVSLNVAHHHSKQVFFGRAILYFVYLGSQTRTLTISRPKMVIHSQKYEERVKRKVKYSFTWS
jgi:hypothetical protein